MPRQPYRNKPTTPLYIGIAPCGCWVGFAVTGRGQLPLVDLRDWRKRGLAVKKIRFGDLDQYQCPDRWKHPSIPLGSKEADDAR